MRTAYFALTFALAACAGPGVWHQPGVTQSDTSTDIASCQAAAKAEVGRLYSFIFPYPYPLGWNGGRQVGYLEWQQRVETFTSYEEARLAAACMREKGYRQEGERQASDLPVASSMALSRTGQYSSPCPSSTARSIISRATSAPRAGMPACSAMSMA